MEPRAINPEKWSHTMGDQFTIANYLFTPNLSGFKFRPNKLFQDVKLNGPDIEIKQAIRMITSFERYCIAS